MNCYAKRVLLSVFALVIPFKAFSDEGPTSKMNQDMSKNMPLILQLNQTADIIVVGRATGLPTSTGSYSVATIEIEHVISSVWDKQDVSQHLDINGLSNRVMVLQRMPFSERTAAFFPNGRYLCWLNCFKLSEAEQKNLGLNISSCYELVAGMNDYSVVVPGVVLLSHHRDILDENEYKRSQKILGKDPDWFEGRNIQVNFGITDPKKITEEVSRFARLMVQGKDNDEELRLLSQSQDHAHSRIASCLLKLGKKAQRFRFVDISQ